MKFYSNNVFNGEKFMRLYEKEFAPHLGARTETFRKIFQYLISLNKDTYFIIETGSTRNETFNEGRSTFLFDKFVSIMGGKLLTIDISNDAKAFTESYCSDKVEAVCSDSVKYLWQMNLKDTIDFVYLDSFNLDIDYPYPSAFHHLKEFIALERHLKGETLIVVDDHVNDDCGKGMYIKDFFDNIGVKPYFIGYQIGWLYKRGNYR